MQEAVDKFARVFGACVITVSLCSGCATGTPTAQPRAQDLNYFQVDCKIVDPKQCFFLNNVRSAHATWTSKLGVSRIAVIVYHNGSEQVLSKIEKLVLQSAEKYKDCVLTWD
jgi:hypothetical protein